MEAGELGRVVLLGGLRYERGQTVVTRFRSQRFGALLAYLALFPRRIHSREELAELFWPDADPELGRTNLRTALASLRRQVEPAGAGIPPGSVLVADGRAAVRLENVATDVAAFDRFLAAAARPGLPAPERMRLLADAVAVYGGPLLPGFYETWALTERDRLTGAFVAALRSLAVHHEAAGASDAALDYARRSAAADPLSEEAHAAILRLLVASGQGAQARRHWEEMERLFQKELGIEPAAELRALLSGKPVPKRSDASLPGASAAPPRAAAAPPASDAAATPAAETAAPAAAPPLPPIHLPLTLTRFFGREEPLAQIGTLLDEGRVVTLTGPGGSGKTRLAIEAARTLGEARFSGGIWFVPLGDAADPGDWPGVLCDALGLIPEAEGETDAIGRAETFLRARSGSVLLVLDNCEHLIEATAAQSLRLLTNVPGLSLLATSRQLLQVGGEAEIPVMPLATPLLPGTPERLLEFPAVQLYVSRARAARADFALTPRNASAVAELCHRLEGIPLALELAAGWAQVLSPAQTLARLNKRFDLLVSRRRDVPERHRTLRATIAWSYEGLEPAVQRVFARLSVFAGSWTLEAAEAVCGGSAAADPEADILTALTELRERSLITAEAASEAEEAEDETAGPRLRMLETLREFAAEQLEELGPEERSEALRRHAEFFAGLTVELKRRLGIGHGKHALQRLAADIDNLRAVASRATGREIDPSIGLRLMTASYRFWNMQGRYREALERINALLEMPENSGSFRERASALQVAGSLADTVGKYPEASRRFHEAREIFSALGDPKGQYEVCLTLGNLAQSQNDFDGALAQFRAGEALARVQGADNIRGRFLYNIGELHRMRGEYEASAPYFAEARDLFVKTNDQEGIAYGLLAIAALHTMLERYAEARPDLERCVALSREIGIRYLEAEALCGLGRILNELGEAAEASSLLNQSLGLCREMEDTTRMGRALNELGLLAQADGDLDAAAAHHALALALRVEMGDQQSIAETLHDLARLALRRGQPERAARLIGAADALRQPLGVTPSPRQRTAYEAVERDIRRRLGEARYAEEYAVGRTAPLEQTLAADARETVEPLSKVTPPGLAGR